MMSLATVSTGKLIRQQFIYKCYAVADLWRSLVVIQLIAVLFSVLGTGGMSTSDDMFSLRISTFSNDTVFMFTIFWLVIISALITTKNYRYEDFSYVTTRNISQASNAILLLAIVLLSSLFIVMSNYVIYLAILIFRDTSFYPGMASVGTPGEMLLSLGAVFGYAIVAAAGGYFIGVLIQLSKVFIAVIPVVLFGPAMMGTSLALYEFFYEFYAQEASLTLFLVKMLITAAILYLAGVSILNRREVREL